MGMTISERLRAAITLPDGARFYRCALQVNPFAYLARHAKATTFKTKPNTMPLSLVPATSWASKLLASQITKSTNQLIS